MRSTPTRAEPVPSRSSRSRSGSRLGQRVTDTPAPSPSPTPPDTAADADRRAARHRPAAPAGPRRTRRARRRPAEPPPARACDARATATASLRRRRHPPPRCERPIQTSPARRHRPGAPVPGSGKITCNGRELEAYSRHAPPLIPDPLVTAEKTASFDVVANLPARRHPASPGAAPGHARGPSRHDSDTARPDKRRLSPATRGQGSKNYGLKKAARSAVLEALIVYPTARSTTRTVVNARPFGSRAAFPAPPA